MDFVFMNHVLNIAVDVMLIVASGILVRYFWQEWRER